MKARKHIIPVPNSELSAEKSLADLDKNREHYIGVWGEAEYKRRRSLLEEYIKNKTKKDA